MIRHTLLVMALVLMVSVDMSAQTTALAYQGSLKDSGAPANGSFQMQFKLFDSLSGGTQVGTTLTDVPVTVLQGIFNLKLDFGASVFTGANRWVEVAVRRNSGESYTTLSPREQIASSPYAIKTLSATMADDSQKLGGVNASEYITTTNAGNTFVRNQTTQQAASNFNVSGDGIIGGFAAFGGATISPNFRINSAGPIRAYSNSSAHFIAETIGGTNSWARFYMRSTNRSWFMGTSQNFNSDQLYIVDESANQTRMAISTDGYIGINNSTPQAGLDMRGTGLQTQQRISDNTSGNSLVMQAGSGGNMKVTGYNYNTNTAVPLYLSTDGANTVMNSAGGNILQPGSGFGVPKAMLYVLANGTISRCWNGVTGSGSGNCGFSVFNSSTGLYDVNVGFTVNNRFLSVTSSGNPTVPISCRIQGFTNATTILVRALNTSTNGDVPSDFYLIVY